MIDIYGYNLKIRNTTVITKTKILSIPANNPGELHFINPTVKNDMGNADSMDFSLQSGTPYFDAMQQMITYIEVVYDGDSIFFGRVLTIENGAFGTRKVKCEGALSFLIDSQYPGSKEELRQEISVLEYIQQLIDNHNSQMNNDPHKLFYVGEVPGNYSSSTSSEQRIKTETRKFGNNSWRDTKSNLEELRDRYGGLFRVRRSNGKNYIDWLNNYFRSAVNDQKIEIGKNLIDISNVTEVNNIFTALIPIGKPESGNTSITLQGYRTDIHGDEIYITVPQICSVYSANELNSGYHTYNDYHDAISRYGMVFKTQEFSEANTQEQLFNDAFEWIKENYQGGIDTFTVKAVDIHQVGAASVNKILIGDRVTLIYKVGLYDGSTKTVTKTLTCTSINYDLYNPEANNYSFGIPSNMLKTSSDGKQKKVKSNASASGGASMPETEIPESDPLEAWLNEVRGFLGSRKPYYKNNVVDNNGRRVWETGFDKTKAHYAQRSHVTALDPSGHIYMLVKSTSLTKGEYELFVPETPVSTNVSITKQASGNIEGSNDLKASARYWTKYSQRDSLNPGLPKGGFVFISDISYDLLTKYHIFEYVIDEYGIDLRNGLKVPMPSIVTSDDGSSVFFHSTYSHDKVLTYSPVEIGSMTGVFTFAKDKDALDKFCTVSAVTSIVGCAYKMVDTVKENLFGGIFNYSNPGEMVQSVLGNGQSLVTEAIENLNGVNYDASTGSFSFNMDDLTKSVLGADSPVTKVLDKFKGLKDEASKIKEIISSNGLDNVTAMFDGTNGFITSLRDSFGNFNLFNRDSDTNLEDGTTNLGDTDAKANKNAEDIAKLHIHVLEGDEAFGSLVDGYFLREPNGEYKPQTYKFCQAIEQYKGGEMVVAYVEGNVVRLGNPATAYNYAIAYKEGANIVGALEYVKDSQGIERLYIHSGGGVRVRRGTVDPETGEYIVDSQGNTVYSEFGIYDENNLTAGVITTMINGSTFDFIKGDHVVIGDYGTYKNVVNAFNDVYGDVDKLEGFVAQKASIVDLDALHGRINDLDAAVIKTNDLYAKIANLSVVKVKALSSDGAIAVTTNAGYVMAPIYYIGTPGDAKSFDDVVTDVQIVGPTNNIYKLQKKRASTGDNWIDTDVSFSRATTLSLNWSSGKFPLKVEASPQGNEKTIGFTNASNMYLLLDNVEGDDANRLSSTSDKFIFQDVAIFENLTVGGETSKQNRYQTTLMINATKSWDKGRLYGRNETIINEAAYSSLSGSQGQLTYSRYITYTTNAPTRPTNGTRTLYMQLTGGTSWSSNSTTVTLQTRGTSSATWVDTAKLAISGPTPSDWQLNYQGNTNYAYNARVKIGGTWYNSKTLYAANAFDNGVTAGRDSVHKITLRNVNERAKNLWWNYLAYNSSGMKVKDVQTDQGENDKHGLYIPYADPTITISANTAATGTHYSATSFAITEGSSTMAQVLTGFTVIVNVPSSGESHTHSNTFNVSVTYNSNGTKTLTLTATYSASQSVPFNDGSSKKLYW